MFNLFKKLGAYAVGLIATLTATAAHAVIDTTAVLGGIADAGIAILAVVGALLAMSVSIFGLVKVYKFVASKAGA